MSLVRVLVVDDDPSIRDMLELSLTLEGFGVETADDGVSALQALQNTLPDVILLDIMMPFLNGYEVIERLRDDAGGPVVPIIVLTAKARDEDIWEGWARGAESYLTKPFDIEVLLDEVARVTSHR